MHHDDLTTLTDDELKAIYATVDRVMTVEAVTIAARIYREFVRRTDAGLQDRPDDRQ